MVLTAEFLGQRLNQRQCSPFADKPYDLQNLISWALVTFPPQDSAFMVTAKKAVKQAYTHWHNESLLFCFFVFFFAQKHINIFLLLIIH